LDFLFEYIQNFRADRAYVIQLVSFQSNCPQHHISDLVVLLFRVFDLASATHHNAGRIIYWPSYYFCFIENWPRISTRSFVPDFSTFGKDTIHGH